MPRQKETPAIPAVHEALDVLTIEQLKPLVALLPTAERPTRKGELVALIEQYLSGKQLRALWEQLDETQKLAVAETIHYEHRVFNAQRFRAKCGALPVFGTKKDSWGYGEIPSLLETVAEILDLIWTGQVIAFILPVPSFFSRGANDVRTG